MVNDAAGGFAVADDGPGVPPEHRGLIFERGFSTTSEGPGYGLSIVADIAIGADNASAYGRAVGGTESEWGGARFGVTGVAVE